MNLEMHSDAVIELVWRCTWRWSMGGAPGANETLFISSLTRNCGNVMR